MKYDNFSDLMSRFDNLHNKIPITDERSAPLVEFYKYWSNYLEPTPAYLAFLTIYLSFLDFSDIWGIRRQ